MCVRKDGCECADCIYLVHYTDSWDPLNVVMYFRFHERPRICWLAKQLSVFQEELCFVDLLT
jgi:hypothetical protein